VSGLRGVVGFGIFEHKRMGALLWVTEAFSL